ncbi:MAG: carbohydrate binding domain-containing protein [Clostridiales bacterium]
MKYFKKSKFAVVLTFLVIVSLTFIFNPIYGADVEILINQGFEDGTSGWLARSGNFSVTDSQAHSGSHSGLSTNRTSTWMGIKQSVLDKMSAGETYNISAWVRTSGTDDNVQISVEQNDGDGTQYIAVASGTANNSGWTELSGTFTFNPNGVVTVLDVYIEGPEAGIDIYVDDASVYGPEAIVETVDANIDLSASQQIIKGFGASSAWCGALSDEYMDTMFSTQGLSIVRCRIAPNDNWKNGDYSLWSNELSNAKKAIARGAIVFASPWTPPAYMKTNNNTVGGSLSTDYYEEYAEYLKKVADYFADNGAPLYAISLQNEPDWDPDYEGCTWTAEQFRTFIKDYGDIITSSTKIMMPESTNFDHEMSDATLNDPDASPYVSIIGGHLYGGGLIDYPLAQNMGKELWMTEYCYLSTDAAISQSLDECLNTAKQIHDCMTVGKMNAYVWWWVISDSNGLYNSAGEVQKRGYVMGQFAKFVHDGYYNVDTTLNPQTNVYVSGYTGDGKAVIVAINKGDSAVDQNFVFQNGNVSSVTPYVTSENENIKAKSNIDVSGNSFNTTLQANSITTFVGDVGSIVTSSKEASPTITPTISPTTIMTDTPTAEPTTTTTTTTTETEPSQEAEISVKYEISNDWGSGATCNVVLTNNSDTVKNNWMVSWNFSGNQVINNVWNGVFTQDGTNVSVSNVEWNSSIPVSGTVSFGFNLSYSGTNSTPTNFVVN